jgi:hypothetical protein
MEGTTTTDNVTRTVLLQEVLAELRLTLASSSLLMARLSDRLQHWRREEGARSQESRYDAIVINAVEGLRHANGTIDAAIHAILDRDIT